MSKNGSFSNMYHQYNAKMENTEHKDGYPSHMVANSLLFGIIMNVPFVEHILSSLSGKYTDCIRMEQR